MRKHEILPPNTRHATEDDFRENGLFVLWKEYYYFCFGERKYIKTFTCTDTKIQDLKTRIATKTVLVDE